MDNGRVGRKVTTGPSEVPPSPPPEVSQKPASDEEQVKQSVNQLSAQDKAAIKGAYAFDGDIKRASLQNVDLKSRITDASKSKWDGAGGISKQEYDSIKNDYQNKSVSPETIKWMEREHPALHAS